MCRQQTTGSLPDFKNMFGHAVINQSGCGFCTPGGSESMEGRVSARWVPSTFAESPSCPFAELLVLQDKNASITRKQMYFIYCRCKRIVPEITTTGVGKKTRTASAIVVELLFFKHYFKPSFLLCKGSKPLPPEWQNGLLL